MEISPLLQHDILCFLDDDLDNIQDFEALKRFMHSEEGMEEMMNQTRIFQKVDQLLPNVLRERVEASKDYIHIIADGMEDFIKWTGEKIEIQKETVRELIIKVGSTIVYQDNKAERGFASKAKKEGPFEIEGVNFTIKISSGKFKDNIEIEQK